MYGRATNWRWVGAVLAAGWLGCLLGAQPAAVGDPPLEAQIQAHLQAGEFAPAAALAQQAADPHQRDALAGAGRHGPGPGRRPRCGHPLGGPDRRRSGPGPHPRPGRPRPLGGGPNRAGRQRARRPRRRRRRPISTRSST